MKVLADVHEANIE